VVNSVLLNFEGPLESGSFFVRVRQLISDEVKNFSRKFLTLLEMTVTKVPARTLTIQIAINQIGYVGLSDVPPAGGVGGETQNAPQKFSCRGNAGYAIKTDKAVPK